MTGVVYHYMKEMVPVALETKMGLVCLHEVERHRVSGGSEALLGSKCCTTSLRRLPLFRACAIDAVAPPVRAFSPKTLAPIFSPRKIKNTNKKIFSTVSAFLSTTRYLCDF
jgi:hypothetical protein